MSPEVRVVIPSKSRPIVGGQAASIFVDPILVVPATQVELYQTHNPKTTILGHPENLYGLGEVRQWILDTVPDETVFMCDDDVKDVRCLVGSKNRKIVNPDTIQTILENSARIAKGIGTVLFGFAQIADVRKFEAHRPFGFTGVVFGHNMGIIGRSIRFDPKLPLKQDIDFSLQVLLKCRVLWRDKRFAFNSSRWFKRTGGSASWRTSDLVNECISRLKVKWGDAIEISHFDRGNRKTHTNVKVNVTR